VHVLVYNVDRAKLEAESTENILRILAEERDDYTPEALEIFENIIKARGVSKESGPEASPSWLTQNAQRRLSHEADDLLIKNPSDAVVVLNNLLQEVLNGSLDAQVGQTAANMVMAILRAMEQEFMTESQEES
jgi:hypothetical protein